MGAGPSLIARRLSTLRSFDRIVVLQSGQVCEEGSPQMLVRSKGVYSSLVRREVARLSNRRPDRRRGLLRAGLESLKRGSAMTAICRELLARHGENFRRCFGSFPPTLDQ